MLDAHRMKTTGVGLGLLILLGLSTGCQGLAQAEPLPDPLAAGWQGEPVCTRLHEDDTQRILRCHFEPGIGHERHFHAPHFGYALSGGRVSMTDESGTRVRELETGSFYTSDGVAWHEIKNVGDTPITYLIIEPK